VTKPSQASNLRDRFTSWYHGQPAVSRDRRFSMSEFEAALKTQGKYISQVLLELGWRRKRIWSTTGQYHRYWEPPPHASKAGQDDIHAGRSSNSDRGTACGSLCRTSEQHDFNPVTAPASGAPVSMNPPCSIRRSSASRNPSPTRLPPLPRRENNPNFQSGQRRTGEAISAALGLFGFQLNALLKGEIDG
jgi:hypothetical protein